MKKYLWLASISFLSFGSPSFAFLDEPLVLVPSTLVLGSHNKVLPVKNPEDFRSQNPRYQGICELHNDQYPKMPLIRPYSEGTADVPFSAPLCNARASQLLEDIHFKQLSGYKKVYSFVVQSMIDEKRDGVERPHALKPHYLVHAHAPLHAPRSFTGNEFVTPLRWTALSGAVGHVEPADGGIQKVGLLRDSILTHPRHPHNTAMHMRRMLVSPDNLHLRGIHHQISTDMTSLVAFTDDQGHNIAAFTYHWLLNAGDLTAFRGILEQANTFRALIDGLAIRDSFKPFVRELRRYIQQPVPQQVPALKNRSTRTARPTTREASRPTVGRTARPTTRGASRSAGKTARSITRASKPKVRRTARSVTRGASKPTVKKTRSVTRTSRPKVRRTARSVTRGNSKPTVKKTRSIKRGASKPMQVRKTKTIKEKNSGITRERNKSSTRA